MIDRDELAALTSAADLWLQPLQEAMGLYDIGTPEREAHFLAQCAHESDGFRHLVENLNYSASVLLQVFGSRFTPQQAVDYAHNAEGIANRVYGGRLGNGDEASGDGWLFRGRGLIQITGRENYTRFGRAVGTKVEENPDLLAQPQMAALSAAWFWSIKGCNELADAGDFVGITKRINGGTEGIDDRARWLAKAKTALDTGQA